MSLTPEKTLLVMESGETEIRTPESLDSPWFRKSVVTNYLNFSNSKVQIALSSSVSNTFSKTEYLQFLVFGQILEFDYS